MNTIKIKQQKKRHPRLKDIAAADSELFASTIQANDKLFKAKTFAPKSLQAITEVNEAETS